MRNLSHMLMNNQADGAEGVGVVSNEVFLAAWLIRCRQTDDWGLSGLLDLGQFPDQLSPRPMCFWELLGWGQGREGCVNTASVVSGWVWMAGRAQFLPILSTMPNLRGSSVKTEEQQDKLSGGFNDPRWLSSLLCAQ